ncbi:MAG: hypothetical protein Q9191_003703 [Dirinaria sp. TL-2023a]
MSSRFQSGRGDSRYPPRDRSPPRFPDRRSSGPYGSGPLSARTTNDPPYRSSDPHPHSGSGREPPRGPKAFSTGPGRGPYGTRGRGFRGRGDGLSREFRDSRDISAARRERDHREWGWRERDPSRERRTSPIGRNRSRSPPPRDYRDTREFVPRDGDTERSRRDSREAFAQPSPAVLDPPLATSSASRGGFPARGRTEREYSRKSRGSFSEDRENFRPRSRSRERPWERRAVDDRDRDWTQGQSRRDEYSRKEWDDKDREHEKSAKEVSAQRSGPDASASVGSTSVSPRPGYHSVAGRSTYSGQEMDMSPYERAGFDVRNTNQSIQSQAAERRGSASQEMIRELPPQRASSPPQAPQVPAFGSIVYPKQSTDLPSGADFGGRKAALPPVSHAPLSMVNVPSAPKAQILGSLPTGPKAEQTRHLLADSTRTYGRFQDSHEINKLSNTHTLATETPSTASASSERSSNTNRDARMGQTSPQIIYGRAPTVTSADKARDGAHPQSTTSSNANAVYQNKQYLQDAPSQSSPVKIPTGPKADRSRAPPWPTTTSPAHAVLGNATQRPPRQPNLTWVRPGLARGSASMMSSGQPKHLYARPESNDASDGDNDDGQSLKAPESPTKALVFGDRTPKYINVEQALSQNVLESSQAASRRVSPKTEDLGEPPDLNSITKESEEAGKESAISEDEEMDLDEEYHADERKFRQELRLLEAKRPASPPHNKQLLLLMDEIDALASAAEDRANGVSPFKFEPQPADERTPNAYPSPQAIEDESCQLVPGLAHSPIVQAETPPMDSLPYLASGPPTPFSEMDELQEHSDFQEIIDAQLLTELRARLKIEETGHEEIKSKFYEDYKAWRLSVEAWEEKKKADNKVPSVPSTPAPISTPFVQPAPVMEGRRSGRNVSELDFERAIRESVMYQAEEERRREQEAKSSINPEKEAVIPDMLEEHEVQTHRLIDTTNRIDSKDAYRALGYVPKEDDFSFEEQDIFTESFLANPKKFGLIAKDLPNRSYQECIRHYYLTKHEAHYKEKYNVRMKRGKAKPGRKGLPSKAGAGAPSLMPTSMVDEIIQIAVTDTGRPRRAAAPTFGGDGEADTSTPSITPNKRNISGAKGDGGEPIAEKPTAKRTRAIPAKEKGARKGKNLLLAAAPGPSPQKVDKERTRGKSKEPKLESGQQLEEFRTAELLANLHNNQSMPSFNHQQNNEAWLATQPVAMSNVGATAKPPYAAQEPLQPQHRGAPPTSSYWSVPEQTDFNNLLQHFGTNWQAIADHMKTKTQTMVKNYYHRQIERGDSRALEEAASAANEKIKRGEDMGLPPPPTIVQKRRYDTGPQIAPPRPLAPSVETTEIDKDSAGLQPSKPIKVSPPQLLSGSQRPTSTLIPGEPASSNAASPGPLLSSTGPPVRPTSQSQQQRGSQPLQGPRSGFFSDDRTRPALQPQPAAPSQPHQQIRQQPQSEGHPLRSLLDSNRPSNFDEPPVHAHDRARQDNNQGSSRYQQPVQPSQSSVSHQSTPLSQQPSTTSQKRIAPLHSVDINIQPRVATHQQLTSQQHPSVDQRQEQQRLENQTAARRTDGFGQPRQTPIPSSANTRPPLNFSPPQDGVRPNSVPAAPPPPQPPKRSNIMSILNDEPAEPQTRKRVSDSRPSAAAAPTPPPQSPAGPIYQQQPTQPVMQYMRRDPSTGEAPSQVQQHHQRSSLGQVLSQHPPPQHQAPYQAQHQAQHQAQQSREPSTNWATVAQRNYLERQQPYQQPQRAESPRSQTTYPPPATSRTPLQSMPRSHAPTPPPSFGHSRNSSFVGLQSHPQPPPPHQLQSQATPVLHPSPYTQIHPQQQMHPHHQHQHSQSMHHNQHQSQTIQHTSHQQHQQQHQQAQRQDPPRNLFPDTYKRHPEALRQEEPTTIQPPPRQQQHQQAPGQGSTLSLYQDAYSRRQEALRQDTLREEEALRQRQQQEQSRPDMLQYRSSRVVDQARRDINDRARREETGRGTYTPPGYGHGGGYGPPPDERPREYDDRR